VTWLRVVAWGVLLVPSLALVVLAWPCDLLRLFLEILSRLALAAYRFAALGFAEAWIDAKTPKADKQRREKLDRIRGQIRRARRGVR
jgi:hypothetical protein